MRNRAKCKLCNSIIESLKAEDAMECACGQISVYGGEELFCSAVDWKNFVRVDDDNNEVIVKVEYSKKEADVKPLDIPEDEVKKPMTRKEMLGIVEDQLMNLDNLPAHAMQSPLTHYDYQSLLMMFASFLRLES